MGWLEALPSSTVIDLMQRRCCFIASMASVSLQCRQANDVPPKDNGFIADHLESFT